MNEDEFRMLYNHACIAADRMAGQESRRSVHYMLQMINGLRDDLNKLREKEVSKDG